MSQPNDEESQGNKENNTIVIDLHSNVALPWIVSFAFSFDVTKIKNPGYQVECEAFH